MAIKQMNTFLARIERTKNCTNIVHSTTKWHHTTNERILNSKLNGIRCDTYIRKKCARVFMQTYTNCVFILCVCHIDKALSCAFAIPTNMKRNSTSYFDQIYVCAWYVFCRWAVFHSQAPCRLFSARLLSYRIILPECNWKSCAIKIN